MTFLAFGFWQIQNQPKGLKTMHGSATNSGTTPPAAVAPIVVPQASPPTTKLGPASPQTPTVSSLNRAADSVATSDFLTLQRYIMLARELLVAGFSFLIPAIFFFFVICFFIVGPNESPPRFFLISSIVSDESSLVTFACLCGKQFRDADFQGPRACCPS